ncbi:HpcH/HpaI aldolase family protein [Blastopirellula marina]|uniref:HpcH/HpaI aldolase n=1 Tax=Blastopirellula marina DSM 3645 TaxID=314230 RepID=A3ZQ68_9BACT|nr:aldolase/citrate lyase family protein [Blastopirellula marina]EAQ81341.1 HpcH/HpaI aldolase [Blastopirellula marina DSM 3645]
MPAALAGSGLDFVFIDTEHIALDRAELSWMCQTYQQLGMAPLVRIPEPNPNLATMVLDGGAAGVIAPYVETAEQVRALVGAVKCRPLKGERLERYLQGESLGPELQQYIEQHNSQHTLVINVESTPAIAAIDDLLAVNGLDAVLVGPHDLSCSLGIPEQYDHPRFDQAMQTIIRKARARQVGAGIHFWGDVAQEVDWLRQGLNMLIHSADISLFVKQLRAELTHIQSELDPLNKKRESDTPGMIA